MGFESSQFGDGSATGSGNVTTQVNNHYGPRVSERAQGVVKTEGISNQLSVDFTGQDVSDGAFPLIAPELPAGATITGVFIWVKEAFVLGGTTPVIDIGTEGSEATNGVGSVSEADAEATGYYDYTSSLAGTWASPLAADTTVGIALNGGGSNTVDASAGRAEIVIEYSVVA